MDKKHHFSLASEKGHFNGLVDEGRYLIQSSLYMQILPRTPSRQIRSLPTFKVDPRNLCNPWLIKELRLCKAPDNWQLATGNYSTTVESALQNNLFMQNKANFQKSQMNVTDLFTRDYVQMDTWWSGKNKANSNPIQSQFKPNTKPIQTQYKANSNPIQSQNKSNQTQFIVNLPALSAVEGSNLFQTAHLLIETMGTGFLNFDLKISLTVLSNSLKYPILYCERDLFMKTFMAKKNQIEQKWLLVDAEGAVLGRLAAKIAPMLMGKNKPTYTPHVDTGDYVIVINADKIKVTGKKAEMKQYDYYTHYPGGHKFVSFADMMAKKPEKVVELAVRRMLPKNKLGRAMLKKLKVYRGPEHNHQAQKPEKIELF